MLFKGSANLPKRMGQSQKMPNLLYLTTCLHLSNWTQMAVCATGKGNLPSYSTPANLTVKNTQVINISGLIVLNKVIIKARYEQCFHCWLVQWSQCFKEVQLPANFLDTHLKTGLHTFSLLHIYKLLHHRGPFKSTVVRLKWPNNSKPAEINMEQIRTETTIPRVST